MTRRPTIPATILLALTFATPLHGQAPARQPDVMVATIQAGATHIRSMFTIAAEQMSEADYAYRPTPETRTFGQLLAHVAETNYYFCAAATGETRPVTDVEKTRTTRADLQKALAESFDYCDRALAAMNDAEKAKAMRTFRDQPMPALPLLNFRNYHSLLHWGNAITYMRLRGKVPPSA
jgi:uncharacterized damage-inducible protein DinB